MYKHSLNHEYFIMIDFRLTYSYHPKMCTDRYFIEPLSKLVYRQNKPVSNFYSVSTGIQADPVAFPIFFSHYARKVFVSTLYNPRKSEVGH